MNETEASEENLHPKLHPTIWSTVALLAACLAMVFTGTVVTGMVAASAARAQNPLALPGSESIAEDDSTHELYFTRAVYSGLRPRFPSWSIDYPKADRQFLIGLQRLIDVDVSNDEHPVRLDDPDLRRYPIIYAVEVGHMLLTEEERRGLRNYLLAGGFLIVDDFWGSWEWANFEREIRAVLPGLEIRDLPLDHPVMHAFFDLDEVLQVPNVYQGREGGPTWEQDGFEPALKSISSEDGRLLVVINWNSDLGDAWEWAEDPYYPLEFSNFAYRLGVNLLVYGMSH